MSTSFAGFPDNGTHENGVHEQKRLNLLMIVCDQLRADYLGCYGHPSIGTVHIDRLAQEGVRFDSCYCAAPLCGPSRISLVTSTYIGEHGHRNYGSTISPDVPNLVSSIKLAGYRTGMFGKNHMFTYARLGEVWDELDEICLGNCDDHPDYEHSFSSFPLERDHPYNITGRLTDEAIDFMQRATQPFFAMINYQDPHPAYTCPEPYASLFAPAVIDLPPTYHDRERQPVRNEVWRVHSEMSLCSDSDMRRAIATYMGQIRYVDDCVGRLYEFLQSSGLLEQTLVVFMSDHGELLGSFGMTHKLPVFYEPLVRIPAIFRFPEQVVPTITRGRSIQGLVEEVDLAPTILMALDIDIPASMVGQALYQDIIDERMIGKDSVLVEAGGGGATCSEPVDGLTLKAPFLPTSLGPGAMVRTRNWKLCHYCDDRCELFNLADDPLERNNLYEEKRYADIRWELTRLLLDRLLSVKNREIGYERWPRTLPPGRDLRFEPLEGYAR